ncbi:CAP domain-containing protein [Legionella sp.]|uniref:CAP domain-containing protein n=1 Tax=Legionella sp. TaxID=459 RepID=UPI003CBD465D
MYLKKSKTIVLSIILLSFLQSAYATTLKSAVDDTTIQNAILIHINKYRQQHGLSQLKMDQKIVKEAKQHSIDMATHKMPFGHKDFTKRIAHLHTRVKNSGAGAENVAYNYKNASTVVQQWLLSPGHKRNIVGNYNLTGIGIAKDLQGRIYYTQIFLRTNQDKHLITRI